MEVHSSGSLPATTKNKDPHKCRGATALKVTEGNVRQELGFRPYSFTTNYPVFTWLCSSVRQPIEASCSPHALSGQWSTTRSASNAFPRQTKKTSRADALSLRDHTT
jgi:hypothetical protein